MNDWSSVKECMADAGCSSVAIRRAEGLYQAGATDDLVCCLRSCRCDMLEEIHAKQKQLDRLDTLIRNTKNM